MTSNPIICAIDKTNIIEAANLCYSIKEHIGLIKLGLEFFTYNGPQGVSELAKIGLPIFLDLKLHDIPNTVSQTIKSIMKLDISIITIHTLGGFDMMKLATETAKKEAKKLKTTPPLIVGVTILTSMDDYDINQIGINDKVESQVITLGKLAKEAGLDGVVCSPKEIDVIKSHCGQNFKTIVPGIRPESSAKGDQKRVMTPIEAINKGADYLVIGRPITESENPEQAAKDILKTL